MHANDSCQITGEAVHQHSRIRNEPEKHRAHVGGNAKFGCGEKSGETGGGQSGLEPASRDRLRTDRMVFHALLQGLDPTHSPTWCSIRCPRIDMIFMMKGCHNFRVDVDFWV